MHTVRLDLQPYSPITLGCIDWTHVHIKKPVNHVEGYIGRKGVPTINVQAVYDASYRITSFTQVHCQLAMAKHDARIC
ncbi:hypothetical protein DPMN_086170 [Dreissena polymorpha]|uniref:Uncharacterized protein n=1 Tax=Dreissena polymorpha TaxID=45954 RepID=A0A9D3YGC4_DREPO|nr:hypothetical protein DPMN_086170 [Dreissena polymorpha]